MKITLSFLSSGNVFGFHSDQAFHELFSIAKELDFDGIDYIATIPEIFVKPKKALLLSKKYNTPILTVHAPMHLLLFTPLFLRKYLYNMFQYYLKAEVFNFHLSGFMTPFHKGDGSVKKFVSFAKQHTIPISFESNPLLKGLGRYPKVTYDPRTFAEYCIEQHVPITFDTSHIAHCNYDIVTFFKKYHKYIKLIHLSDSIGATQHLPLGKGTLPIKELLQEIKKQSYDGIITFEIGEFPLSASKRDKLMAIKESLYMVKKFAL